MRFAVSLLLMLAAARAIGGEPDQPAPPRLSLTIQKAIAAALQKNFTIRVEQFSPLIARQRIRIESGRFDPVFGADYNRQENSERSAVSQTDEFNTGIRGLLPWGTEYRADLTSTREADNDFESGGTLGLTQPLLRNGGTGATLSQLRIARVDHSVSEWELRNEIIDVITEIYFVYNDLYFQMENLEVARRSQALARQLFEDNRRRAEIGTMSPLDITQARAQVASRQEAVILAVSAVRENENLLKQLITDQIQTLLGTRVSIAPPPTAAPFDLNVQAGIKDALQWRPDYRQAILGLEKQKITLAFERNQALPQLDLVGSLHSLGLNRSVADSFRNAFRRDDANWQAGAVFSVPIPNRQGRARATSAQLEAAKQLLDLKRLEQEIVVQVDNAARQIVTSRQRIESTSEATVLARETLDAGAQRLRAGAGTTFELLDLQEKLAQAEAAELRARADYNKAVSEYDRQTGVAIERNGLTIER